MNFFSEETLVTVFYKQGQLIVGFSMYMSQVYSLGTLPYICMRWQTLLNDLCEACFSEHTAGKSCGNVVHDKCLQNP